MNNTQGLRQCHTPNGAWKHLTLDGEHPVCDRTKDATDVADIVLSDEQIDAVKRRGATILASCRRCDKWSKSYVRRATFRELAGIA